jgi:MarR family transcriptional regulator, organic hydroperoxide resistance regulator
MAQSRSKGRPRGSSPSRRRGARFRLETHIFYLFSSILARRNKALNSELGQVGLDYPRWRVLAVLGQHAGASMLQLAELTGVDRTTLAHTVRLMVSERLISRRERQSDRRSVTLEVTARGRAVLQEILPLVLAHNDRALAGFSVREEAALRRQLTRMLDNLKA